MKILTSMNREIYDEYGAEALRRMRNFLPPTMGNHEKVEIVVYWDGNNWPMDDQNIDRLMWLDQVAGFLDFRDYAEQYQHDEKVNERRNAFLWNAHRFACKGFAWGDYLPDDDVIWLDADVFLFDHMPAEFLRSLISNCPYMFLGREGSYSETGFVSFTSRDPDSYLLRRMILEMYRSKEIFKLDGWTDCHVFDYCRSFPEWEENPKVDYGHDIAPDGAQGFDHVFNASILGRYMDHMKGQRKKLGFSPENHASAEARDHGLQTASG